MKYTLVVHQSAVVEAGLVGKVKVEDLCLLHHLRGWHFCDGAKTRDVEGRKFVWLDYGRAIEELPLLFNPKAKISSRTNQLSAMIGKLRKLGLVDTKRIGRRLFLALTDLGIRLTQGIKASTPTVKKVVPTITPPHDETVTSGHDDIVMPSRDNAPPSIYTEPGIKEAGSKESPPLSPCAGDAEGILAFWNSFPELLPAQIITSNRARNIRKRLADPWWREHWREGIKRIATSDYAKGGGRHGWRATFNWLLGGDSLAKILEGVYDNRPQPKLKLLPSDLKAQLKAVDETIASHPANDESSYYEPDATCEQREDLDKLRRHREELVRQLSGVDE